MNETEFHRLADATLTLLSDALEEADDSGALDAEYHDGIITLTLPGSKQIIVNKHTASRQIWLSSPVSGGWHFNYNPLPLREGEGGGVVARNSLAEYVARPPSLTLPLKGGGDNWTLADGRSLAVVLAQELQSLANIEVHF